MIRRRLPGRLFRRIVGDIAERQQPDGQCGHRCDNCEQQSVRFHPEHDGREREHFIERQITAFTFADQVENKAYRSFIEEISSHNHRAQDQKHRHK
ncbi:hypothetical protein D1872_243620 [compost metagenome]